jgi:hypothetical protein
MFQQEGLSTSRIARGGPCINVYTRPTDRPDNKGGVGQEEAGESQSRR